MMMKESVFFWLWVEKDLMLLNSDSEISTTISWPVYSIKKTQSSKVSQKIHVAWSHKIQKLLIFMRSKLFVRLVVVCYLPGLQNAPFCLTMTKKIIGITRSTYDLLKTIEFIKKWFRKRDEIKQKGIYIINVDVFKHPNEIMQFITDLKCTESNSICEYTTYSFTLVIILNIT